MDSQVRCPRCGADTQPGAPTCSVCHQVLAVDGDLTIIPGAAAATVAPSGASSAPTFTPSAAVTAAAPFAVGETATSAARPIALASAGSSTGVVAETAGSLAPGQSFGRYHVIRQLGAGGMGAVYQAWDAELGVAVALKIIRPDTAVDPATREEMERRFKREIVLARQVTHTNVLRIHDLGEIGGLKYISMPYVEGSDLDRLLSKQGRLPIPRALHYGRQIAAGLVAAHAAGVVHRDLKPANAIVDHDDHLYLLDFGIARSMSGPRATMAAGAIGTIDYMSPEQAKGLAADQRADIYAFGLILYDLLLGRRRMESTDSAIAELMHRMQNPPVPMRLIDSQIPDALEQVVARCVDPEPDKRFQHMTEVVEALDRLDDNGHPRADATPAAPTAIVPALPAPRARGWMLPVAAAILLVAVAGGWFAWSRRAATREATAARPPVSVLVADITNNTGDAVFDGIVEQGLGLGIEGASFITAYNRGAALRTAASAIKPDARLTEPNARLVALREGVKVVLAGAVDRDGNSYRIRVRALEPGGAGKTIAEKTVQVSGKAGVLEAVGKLSTDLRRALGDTSVSDDARAETFTAGSLEAAHSYAQAQDLQYAGKREEAIAKYEEAIKLDPDFGRAYSGLATQHANLGHAAEADKYYQAALARIDRMTEREKYRTRGSYYLFSRNIEKAQQEYDALARAFPADTGAMANEALTHFYRRDMAAALEDNKRAVAVYPNNVTTLNNGALYAMYAGQFDTAIGEADKVLKLNPEFAKAYVARALAQLASGRPADAEQTWGKLATITTAGASLAALGHADLALYEGRTKDAIAILEPAIAIDVAAKASGPAARKRAALAEARAAAGDTAAAVREAEQALALSPGDAVQFSAGMLLAELGRAPQASKLAEAMTEKLDADAQAYGRLLRAQIALAQKNPRAALDAVKDAQKAADTWSGRLLLARAYIELGAFAEASSELDVVQKRRGEATAIFLDEVPTWRAYAPVAYWVARVQEGLKSPAAADSYRAFLRIKEKGDEQGLVADARRRLR